MSCFLSLQFLLAKRTTRYDPEPLINALEVKHMRTWQLPYFFRVFIFSQANTAIL